MGVLRTTTAAATGQVWAIRAAATRVKNVRIMPNRSLTAANAFLQLFNTATPTRTGATTGDTDPFAVIPVPAPGLTVGSTVIEGINIPFNGLLFGTGLSCQIASTGAGITAAAAGTLPDSVEVHYTEVA